MSSTSLDADKKSKPLNLSLGFWLTLLFTVIFLGLLFLTNRLLIIQHKIPPEMPAVSLTVTPTYNVTVKTQINGTLFRVLFREGQMVKAGDLLAEIDPRPYQAQLLEYERQIIRDQALLDNARLDLKRYQTLWKQDSISQQTLATQESIVRQYEGMVKLDQGLIQATKVNLYYCEIIAPMDGRIGLRLVDPGHYVTTADITGIAVINVLEPTRASAVQQMSLLNKGWEILHRYQLRRYLT